MHSTAMMMVAATTHAPPLARVAPDVPPEVAEVIDATDHSAGENPFY